MTKTKGTDMKKNNAFVKVEIRGEIDPDAISSRLGLKPQSLWRSNERYRGSGPIVDFSGIIFERSAYLEFTNEDLNGLLKEAASVVDVIKSNYGVISETQHEVIFSVVVYGSGLTGDSGWPEIRLPSSLVTSLVAIRSSIDVDLIPA
jgi:hypothetical protein